MESLNLLLFPLLFVTVLAQVSNTTLTPNTTDISPNATSTEGPKTTAVAPNITTVTPAPTTSATAPPTEAPIPLPDEPPVGTYRVVDEKTKVACLVVKAGFRFEFTYNNGTSSNATGFVDLPTNATGEKASGSCSNDTETLTVDFYSDWSMTLTFERENNDWMLKQAALKYHLTKHYLPKIKDEISGTDEAKNLSMFKMAESTSYQCRSEEHIKFGNATLVEINTFELQLQAGRTKNGTEFNNPSVCPQDTNVSNLVPIIVGAALGALVLIVLIAYLVGRKRNKRGYESV